MEEDLKKNKEKACIDIQLFVPVELSQLMT